MPPWAALAAAARLGHAWARGRGIAAAGAVLVAFCAGSLQGCGMEPLRTLRRGPKEHTSPMDVCPAFGFQGNGFVTETRAGDRAHIICPTDFTYDGPAIECSWVDRFCITDDPSHLNPDFCYNTHNLTIEGQGLTSWPKDIQPKIMLPQSRDAGSKPQLDPKHISNSTYSRRLAAALPKVVSPDHFSCKDETWVDLNFVKAVVDNSQRLDDEYAWRLRYRNITVVHGQEIDLLVTTVKVNISGNVGRTGKGSAMGRINVNCSNTVPFMFKFVKTFTDKAIVLKKVFFTLFDIVDETDPENDKQITVGSMQEYFITEKTQVVAKKLDNGEYTFGRGPVTGNKSAKAMDPEKVSVKDMWLDSLNRSVVLVFRNVTDFMLYVNVNPGLDGRDVEFTGWSELARRGTKVLCGSQNENQAEFDLLERSTTYAKGRLAGALAAVSLIAAALSAVALALRRLSAPADISPCLNAAAE